MTDDRPSQDTDTGVLSRYARLAREFVALADTLVDDFDVVEVLDQLARTCVDLLEVTSAGLLLIDQHGTLQLVASSNEATRVVELYQLQTREGPCVDAVRTGHPTSADSMQEMHARWPRFADAASAAGFRSVHAFPLRLRDETLGALNLFSTEVPAMSRDEQQIAQALADVATIGILQQRSRSRSSLLSDQLQSALNSRILIEQAKGVLAEHGKIEMDAAFNALRAHARSTNTKLAVVAARVVSRELPPDQVSPPPDAQP